MGNEVYMFEAEEACRIMTLYTLDLEDMRAVPLSAFPSHRLRSINDADFTIECIYRGPNKLSAIPRY